MGQRLSQVCLTYILRLSPLLIGTGYLIACWLAVEVPFTRNHNTAPTIPLPGRVLYLESRRAIDQDAARVRSIDWTPDPFVPWNQSILEPFSNLTSLKIAGNLKSGAELKVLRQPTSLTALTYLGDLSGEALEYIGELRQLRYLHLMRIEKNQGIQHLRELTQLRVLDLIEVDDYSRLFDQIRHLPNLQTLVLPEPTPDRLRISDWELLRSLPRLQRIYLNLTPARPLDYRPELDRIQRILPAIQIRPAKVSDRRPNAWGFIAGAGGLIWGLLFIQFQSHFSHAASRVLPNYARSHLTVAVTLVVLTTAVHTWILWEANCSFAASLAGSLIAPALLWTWVNVSQRATNAQYQATSLHPALLMVLCFQFFPLIGFFIQLFVADIDWFLGGQQPVFAWSLIVLCVVPYLVTFKRVPRWHNIYAESGTGTPPLGFNLVSWNAWYKEVAVAHRGWQMRWFQSSYTKRLDSLLAEPGSHSLSQLFSAINAASGVQICLRFGLMAIPFTVSFLVFHRLGIGQANQNAASVLPLLMMVAVWLDTMSLSLVFFWRWRQALLGYELLRPLTRKGFVSRLGAALWSDLLPMLILHPVVLILFALMLGQQELPWHFLPMALCYCVFRGLTLYAALLFSLTIRRDWGLILLLPLTCAIVMGAGVYVGLGTVWPSVRHSLGGIGLYVTGSLVMALLLVWLKGYWQRVELA